MKERNIHFQKKYQKAKSIGDFFVYIVSSRAKSNFDLILNRELHLLKLKRLSIPSSFRLEKTHNVQGPIVNLIYGYNLNFVKLNYLEKLQVLGIKIDDLMYSHQTLKDVVFYKNTVNLCCSLNLGLLNKLTDFVVLSLLEKKSTNGLSV